MSNSGGGPRLKPEQMQNPRLYVVDSDVKEVRDLVERHAGELARWRFRDELPPTACAILAFCSYFRGLRSGRDGCGIQLSLSTWSSVLGRSRRMVQYAFDELVARGFIFRRRRYVKLKDGWTDAKGRKHEEADVRYCVYLTALGARRIERRGELRDMHVRAKGGPKLILRVVGIVGDLFTTLSRVSKAIAARVTDADERCTPSYGDALARGSGGGVSPSGPRDFLKSPLCELEGAVEKPPDGGNARSHDGPEGDGLERFRALEALRKAAGRLTFDETVELLWREGRTTAELWQPDLWRERPDKREWLQKQFRPIAAAMARMIHAGTERAAAERAEYEREAF